MKKNRRELAVLVCVAAILVAAYSGPASGSWPEEVVSFARISNPEEFLKGLDEFSQGLSLPPQSGALKMLFGQAIKNPSLTGLDLAGPIGVMVFDPPGAESWAASFALKDPAAYLGVLNKNLELASRDEESGVTVYVSRSKEFDMAAYQAATKEEQADTSQFFRETEKRLAVAVKGKTAWYGLDPVIVKRALSVPLRDFARSVNGQLVIGSRMLPLVGAMEKFKSKFSGELPVKADAAEREAFQRMMGAYFDFYLHYLGQVEAVAYGVTVNAGGVAFETLVSAVPGRPLETFFKSQKKGKLSLARYLDKESWLAADWRLSNQEMLLEFHRRLIGVVQPFTTEMAAASPDNEKAAEYISKSMSRGMELMEEFYLNIAGDETAISLSSSPESLVSVVALQRIKDLKAWREYTQKNLLHSQEALKGVEDVGISLDLTGMEKPVRYGDIEIFSAEIGLDLTKGLGKKEEDKPEHAKRKELLARLSRPLVMQWAAVNGLAVTEMSWGARPDIRARLDLIRKGEQSFDTASLGEGWKTANGVVYFSVNRYMRDFMKSIIATAGELTEAKEKPFAALSKVELPLVMRWEISGAELKSFFALPIDRIIAVKSVIEELSAKAK